MEMNTVIAFALAYFFVVAFSLFGEVVGRKEGALSPGNIRAVIVRSAVYLAIIIAGYAAYMYLFGQGG